MEVDFRKFEERESSIPEFAWRQNDAGFPYLRKHAKIVTSRLGIPKFTSKVQYESGSKGTGLVNVSRTMRCKIEGTAIEVWIDAGGRCSRNWRHSDNGLSLGERAQRAQAEYITNARTDLFVKVTTKCARPKLIYKKLANQLLQETCNADTIPLVGQHYGRLITHAT